MSDPSKLEATGNLEEALSLYVRASRWDDAARVALSLDKNLEAAKFCLAAHRPYDAAVCFQKAGDNRQCLDALKLVSPNTPRYRGACVHAVRVALTLGTPLVSLMSFAMAFISSVPTSPAEASALDQLASAFAKADKLRLAGSIFRSVLSVYPDDPEASEGLAAVIAKEISPPAQPAPHPPGAPAAVGAAPPPVWASPPTPFAGKVTPRASAPRTANRALRLGELLIARGQLKQIQLDLVFRQQPELKASDLTLGEALVASGMVGELAVVEALSADSGIPHITEEKLLEVVTPAAARALALDFVERWMVAPISLVDRHLTVAMRDPRDIAVIDKVRFAAGVNQVIGLFATELAIRRAISKLYHAEDFKHGDAGEWRHENWDRVITTEAPKPFSDRYTGTRERQFDTQDLEKRMKAEIGSEPEPEAKSPAAPTSVPKTASMITPPSIGTIFAGRYQLEALIGEGGSATVFRATDTELNEPVAIKLFRPSTPAEAEHLVARFKLELSLSRQLSHPNIIRLFDLGSHDGWRYLTMELLEGTDLAMLLANGTPLPPLKALRALEQICIGLEHAHAHGVIHRDIKPQNLFITREGVVKLMDFGIAKKLHSPGVTVLGMVAGTPEFISPEQIKSFSSVTHLSDLYSLGATAYMMFTGAPPFSHPELIGLLMAHASEPPAPMRTKNGLLPAALDEVILRLLEKDPAKRFQSAQSLGEALKKIRLFVEAGLGPD